MSTEADTAIRAALAGHPPLTLLVANRIAHDAVPQDSPTPYVVITRPLEQPEELTSLSGELMATEVIFEVACWGSSRAQANAVADAARVVFRELQQDVTSRGNDYDPQTDQFCTVLVVDWWQDPPD
jgi:hypothetical protein